MYVDWKINNENPELLKFKRDNYEITFYNYNGDSDTINKDPNGNTGDEFNDSNITENTSEEKDNNRPAVSVFDNNHIDNKPEDKGNHDDSRNNPGTSSGGGTENKYGYTSNPGNSNRNSNGKNNGNTNEKNNGNSDVNNNKTSSSNSPSNNGNSNINDGNIDNNTFNRNPNDFSTLPNTSYVESETQSPVNYFTVILVVILIFVFIGFFSAVVFTYYNNKSKRKLYLNNNKSDTLSRMSQVPLNDVYILDNTIDSINNQVIMNNSFQGYTQPLLNIEQFNIPSVIYVETPQKSNDSYVEQTKFTYHPTKEEIDSYAQIDANKLKFIENFNGMQ